MIGCCEFLTAILLFILAPFVALGSVFFPILLTFLTIYALDKLFLRKDAKCLKSEDTGKTSRKQSLVSQARPSERKVSDYGTASEKGDSDNDESIRKTKSNEQQKVSVPPPVTSNGLNDLERGRSGGASSSSTSSGEEERKVAENDGPEIPEVSSVKRTSAASGTTRTVVLKQRVSEKKRKGVEVDSESENGCCSLKNMKTSAKGRRLRGFVGLLFAVVIVTTICFNSFSSKIEESENPADVQPGSNVDYFFLRFFFGKARSRAFGWCSERTLPGCLRESVLGLIFGRIYGADMEAAEFPISDYPSMQSYFMRGVKEGTFDVKHDAALVSPVQGKVVALGDITKENMRVKQVKQTEYNVKSFLGQEPFTSTERRTKYCVLYLAPGDYHRFHSPAANFHVTEGKHFAGEVLPVSTKLISMLGLDDLFSVNERVVLSGTYGEGSLFGTVYGEASLFGTAKKQMHYAAVAAYNVGGIWMQFDKTLKDGDDQSLTSNDPAKKEMFYDTKKTYDALKETKTEDVTFGKGELVGGFKFGSTIVMVFDTDEGDEWAVKEGDRIHMGEPLLVNDPEKQSA